jgi:hypothetical protein
MSSISGHYAFMIIDCDVHLNNFHAEIAASREPDRFLYSSDPAQDASR